MERIVSQNYILNDHLNYFNLQTYLLRNSLYAISPTPIVDFKGNVLGWQSRYIFENSVDVTENYMIGGNFGIIVMAEDEDADANLRKIEKALLTETFI